jgi:hypothetical protein
LEVEFDKDGCKVNNVHGTVVAQTWRAKNLYLLNVNARKESANVAKSSNERTTLWHQRLGHLNMVSFKKLENMVNGMNLKEVLETTWKQARNETFKVRKMEQWY